MPLRFSLREHKNYAAYMPDYTFSKSAASVLRMATSGSSNLGDGYFFIVVNRAYLNGKYIRFNWRSDIPFNLTCFVYIYDGAYDRTSDLDFPSGAALLTKGNGLLQTVASRSDPFGWETLDVQASLGGGSEDDCTIFFKLHDNDTSFNAYLDLDWIEINLGAGGADPLYDEQFTTAVVMERTGTVGDYGYTSTGAVDPHYVVDLAASFEVGQNSANLPAKFESGQGFADLAAEFIVKAADSQDLTAGFISRRASSQALLGVFSVLHSSDLKCVFRITRIYDLRGTMGVAFYWWGTGEDPEIRVDFILESPTGFWMSSFYDGPARFRYVFLPWGSFTWVSLPEPDLDPHHHGFNEPDKSQIDGFFWTVHTAGVRRVDYIYAPIGVGGDLFAEFIIRTSTSANLSAGFDIGRSASLNLPAEFIARHLTSEDLSAVFESGQGRRELPAQFTALALNEELPAKFESGQGRANLLAGFSLSP